MLIFFDAVSSFFELVGGIELDERRALVGAGGSEVVGVHSTPGLHFAARENRVENEAAHMKTRADPEHHRPLTLVVTLLTYDVVDFEVGIVNLINVKFGY